MNILEFQPGWAYEIFAMLRNQAIGVGSQMSSLAMSVASFIVAFRLLKLAYTMMSDENGSGFGGIRLSQFLRPIILLIAISNVGFVVGVLDDVSMRLTDSIVNTIPVSETQQAEARLQAYELALSSTETKYGLQENLLKKVTGLIKDAEEIKEKQWDNNYYAHGATAYVGSGTINKDLDEALQEEYNEKQKELKETIKSAAQAEYKNIGSTTSFVLQPSANQSQSESEGQTLKYYDPSKGKNPLEEISFIADYSSKVKNAAAEALGVHPDTLDDPSLSSVLQDACKWVFELLYKVMMCFAELTLCILAILFPWALVMSLLDPFKNSWVKMTGQYLTVMFYKVIATGIYWVIVSTRAVAAYATFNEIANETVKSALSAKQAIQNLCNVEFAVVSIVCIAGVFALFKIGSIAGLIIGEGSIGDLGGAGAGAAMSVGKAAAGGAAGAPGKALGTAGNIAKLKK